MKRSTVLRRSSLSLVVLLTFLAACAPAAPASPTAAPAKAARSKAEAPVATVPPPTMAPAQPAEKPAPKPVATTAPAAKPTAQPVPAAKAAEKPTAKSAFDEQAVADFYKGKSIRIIVGAAPGGGFDVASRLVARHLSRHVPGQPSIVVENKPGAAKKVAANAVYNTKPKDGTVIGSFSENTLLQQAIDAPGVEFDGRRFNWLGSLAKEPYACLVRTDIGISSIQDVINGKELMLATVGPGSATHDVPAVMKVALGANFKLVSGYSGVAKTRLAVEGKEADAFCVSTSQVSSAVRPMLEGPSPTVKVLVVTGSEPPDHPLLKGAPAAESLAKTEEAKQLLRAVDTPSQISKPFAFAPEVPKERVAALRHAFAQMFADPEFLADAKQAQVEVDPSTGEQVQQTVQELLSLPPSTLAKLKEILK